MAEQLLTLHRLVGLDGKVWGYIRMRADGTTDGVKGFIIEACKGTVMGKFHPILQGTVLEGDLVVATSGIQETP
jgi:hypothetical protein